LGALGFLYAGPAPTPADEITWGVNFSHRQAEAMDLNWKETYTALLDDLGARHFRLPIYWDQLEEEKGNYNFEAWDWQLDELEKRGGKAIVVVGYKLPRWPECHFPPWYGDLDPLSQDKELFTMLRVVVSHFRERESIVAWQVENEPFLPFGSCPSLDKDLLDSEISLVRQLDSSRPIVITDSGEWSYWLEAGRRADVFGSTLYRFVHSPTFGFVKYTFFTPTFHARKAVFLRLFEPDIPIIVIELQGEPWVTKLPLKDVSFEDQYKTLSPAQFTEYTDFAVETGFDVFYLWGSEWWYWLKFQGKDEIWNKARELFEESVNDTTIWENALK